MSHVISFNCFIYQYIQCADVPFLLPGGLHFTMQVQTYRTTPLLIRICTYQLIGEPHLIRGLVNFYFMINYASKGMLGALSQ